MNADRIDFLKKNYVQGFVAFCGFEVLHIEKGLFESCLKLKKEHKQQDGFVHAGVIATMADHMAGYSAFTLVPDDHQILTIEFKINYFSLVSNGSINGKKSIKFLIIELIIFHLFLKFK